MKFLSLKFSLNQLISEISKIANILWQLQILKKKISKQLCLLEFNRILDIGILLSLGNLKGPFDTSNFKFLNNTIFFVFYLICK